MSHRLPLSRSVALAAAALIPTILTACEGPSQHYGYLALLGRDTISIESVTRTGSTVVSDGVDRFPRVRRRHTVIKLNADESIRHLDMDIRTPSEPAAERDRRVVANVTKDSVVITKTDGTGVKRIAFATGGALAMPHLPQVYSLTDLYIAAALARAPSQPPAAGTEIKLRQYYIDREFDRFPLHEGVVRPKGGGKVELAHDWLAGYGDATVDSSNHMLTYSGARSTYKVEVVRLGPPLPDVEAIGERFAALETSQGGMSQLSVRDTARATIGQAAIWIDYGRPLARGRTLLGNVIPYGEVWRTGANAATQFSTSAPITLAGMKLAPGKYTLWTVPSATGAELIVNKQSGQWGTEYDYTKDLGKSPMTTAATVTPVEKFTISIVPVDAHHGSLVMEWGPFRWTAPIVAP